jgi:hypothetical protein
MSWGNSGRYKMPMSAFAVFKQLGGYDAHYFTFTCEPVTPPEPPKPQPVCCKAYRATKVAMRAGKMYWRGI